MKETLALRETETAGNSMFTTITDPDVFVYTDNEANSPRESACGRLQKFFVLLLSKWGKNFGTIGEQEINFCLVHVNFEAVFSRWFERAIE